MATFIATVAAGLEDIAGEELASFGLTVTGTAPGAVLFEGPEFPSEEAVATLRTLNWWGRGLDRVGVLIAQGDIGEVDACYDAARRIDYRPLIRPEQSFAVRALRRGSHDFKSVDVARAVGQAVIESFAEAAAQRLAVSLRQPDVILRVEIIDDSHRLWLDATGDEPLYRRTYRRQLHPASMRASMAHLMLRLAGWRGEPLLDPMTGIGTIPIEAALWARGIAPGRFRRAPYAIDLLFPAPSAEREPGDDGDAGPLETPAPLLDAAAELDVRGIERYDGHVQGAWLNLGAAGPLPGTRIEKGDATRLEEYIEVGRYGLAVVNPPFGRRVGSTGIVTALYRGFAASAARCGVDKIVALAESKRAMSEALEAGGYEVVRSIAVLYGDLPAHVIVARRVGG